VNNAAGFQQRIDDWYAVHKRRTIRNMTKIVSVLVGLIAVGMYVLKQGG